LKQTSQRRLGHENVNAATRLYKGITRAQLAVLRDLTATLNLSIRRGELLCIDGKWYVSHSGLIRIAHRRRCYGIETSVEQQLSDASAGRWVFRATVHKSPSKIFIGYGDAEPSNVSFLVHGAEMRVAETRAVNRALRKAYGTAFARPKRSDPLLRRESLPQRRSWTGDLPMGTVVVACAIGSAN
jgi:hypothetical protein